MEIIISESGPFHSNYDGNLNFNGYISPCNGPLSYAIWTPANSPLMALHILGTKSIANQ